MKLPPFGSGATSGFEVLLVQGPNFDESMMPGRLTLAKNHSPARCQAALEAIARVRSVSYATRKLNKLERALHHSPDTRDLAAIHFLIAKSNFIYGSVRLTYHRFDASSPTPMFCEVLDRAAVDCHQATKFVSIVKELAPNASSFGEITSWLINPDLPQISLLGLYLPCAVWAFASLFESDWAGIASSRASNSASCMLRRMGARPISDGCLFDPKFMGHIELQTLHSRRYSKFIVDAIESLRYRLQNHPVLCC